MPPLPVVTGKEAVRAFERLGWTLTRVTGSHHVMTKPGNRLHLCIPVHGHHPVSPGTLRSLIRLAEISVEEFVDAL